MTSRGAPVHGVLPLYTTKGPMWGHPVPVLGAISPFLEPFRGRLSPNIDNVSAKLTLRYPHEGWLKRRTTPPELLRHKARLADVTLHRTPLRPPHRPQGRDT
jgi:hypothetical protein